MFKITPSSEEESGLVFSPPAETVRFLLDYSKSLKIEKIQDKVPVKIHLN